MQSALTLTAEARGLQSMQHAVVQDDSPTKRPSPSASTTPQPLGKSDSTQRTTSPNSRSPQKSKAASSQLSAGNVIQPTLSNPQDAELTPPSSSDFSSQEPTSLQYPRSPSSFHSRALPPTGTAPALTPASAESPLLGEFPSELLSGQKRTASGQMKRSSISSLRDLHSEGITPGHSRPSSLHFNGGGGSVAELSQQLRTRLSYAMVKVQNGWQSQTLDEVESLASHQPSPRSSIFDFPTTSNRHSLQSPQPVTTANLQRQWSSSDSSEDHSPQSTSVPGTQGASTNGAYHQATLAQLSGRALGPPADITPGTRRRPTPNGPMNGNSIRTPGTPHRHISSLITPTKQRTPSQNAAMEADAVETLLFMASPINSGYHPSTNGGIESSATSTAQMSSSQTFPEQKSFRFSDNLSSPRRSVSFVDRARVRRRPMAIPSREKNDIEQMLDESDDESSDDGLDGALSLANNRQTKRRSLHA